MIFSLNFLNFLTFFDSGTFVEKLLTLPQVEIRDPVAVREKLELIRRDGPQQLWSLVDFDQTLTKRVGSDGSRRWSAYDLFRYHMSPELGKKYDTMDDRCNEIEYDPKLSIEQKMLPMKECWRLTLEFLLMMSLTREQLTKVTFDSKIELRDGTAEWIELLHRQRVPITILSAGVGDVIETILLRDFEKIPNNLHIVSNFLNYDPQSNLTSSFHPPMIHAYNKKLEMVPKSIYSSRKNILLMGDNVGDSRMDSGIDHDGATLKIGFLNVWTKALKQQHLDAFDIVVIGDQTMVIPYSILHFLFQ